MAPFRKRGDKASDDARASSMKVRQANKKSKVDAPAVDGESTAGQRNGEGGDATATQKDKRKAERLDDNPQLAPPAASRDVLGGVRGGEERHRGRHQGRGGGRARVREWWCGALAADCLG